MGSPSFFCPFKHFLLSLLTLGRVVGVLNTTFKQDVQPGLSDSTHPATDCEFIEHGLSDLKVRVIDAFGRQILHESGGHLLCAFDTALLQGPFDSVGDGVFKPFAKTRIQPFKQPLDWQQLGQADRNANR